MKDEDAWKMKNNLVLDNQTDNKEQHRTLSSLQKTSFIEIIEKVLKKTSSL